MKYLHAIKGGFIALVLFSIGTFFLAGIGPSEDVRIILTVSTFLFAILAGFFISRLNNRYNKIIESTSIEDSYFLSLYEVSTLISKSFSKRIGKLIDNYYILAYDFDAGKYYKSSSKYFLAIYDEMRLIFKKIYSGKKSRPSDSPFGRILIYMGKIEEARNKSAVLVLEKLRKGQWAILFFLGAIIIFSIFYLKVPQLYSQVITVLLSTSIVLVLLILRDLQNLRIGTGESLLAESGQEVFEFIGELRYYNQESIESGLTKVPSNIKKYRLGLHKPGEKPRVKIVTNRNYKH